MVEESKFGEYSEDEEEKDQWGLMRNNNNDFGMYGDKGTFEQQDFGMGMNSGLDKEDIKEEVDWSFSVAN